MWENLEKSRKLKLFTEKMPIAEKIQRGFSENYQPFIIRTGAAVLGLFLASVALSRIIYPFDLGYQEAFSWMPATHLLEGKNPYAFALTPPYSMAPYGIVYYALLAVGVGLFGFQLWWGRLLSVLAFAVGVWAVAKITKKITGSREAARASILFALALFPAQMWIGVMRSDFIALAFALAAAALVFARAKDEPFSPGRIFLIILLCGAAFFTKHSFLLPFGIIFLRFLQLNKWREAGLFAAGLTALVAAGMWSLNYSSDGGYIRQHFAHARGLPFSLEHVLREVPRMLLTPTLLAFAAGLLFAAFKNRERLLVKDGGELMNKLRSPKALILFYLFLSFAAATISCGRVGANINYYLENSFVIAVTGGLIYEDFRRKAMGRLAAALIVLMIGGGAFQLARAARGEYFRWQARGYYREIEATAAKYAPAGSVCFSIYVELVARAGCAFHFDDYGEYTTDWTPELAAVFNGEVHAGRYAVVVWDKPDFQEKFANYELIKMTQPAPERFFPVFLYVRKTEVSQ